MASCMKSKGWSLCLKQHFCKSDVQRWSFGRKCVEVTKSSGSNLNSLQLTIPGSAPLPRSTSTPHGFYHKPSSVSCQVSLKYTQILFPDTNHPTEMETHSLKWLCFSCDPKQPLPFSNTDGEFCRKVGNSSRMSKRGKLSFIQALKMTLTWMNEKHLWENTYKGRVTHLDHSQTHIRFDSKEDDYLDCVWSKLQNSEQSHTRHSHLMLESNIRRINRKHWPVLAGSGEPTCPTESVSSSS